MAVINLKLQGLLTFILFGIHTSLGAVLFRSLDALPQDVKYDFIIAGGGTGGALVATRLGENPHWKVLVVEAGPSNDAVFDTRVPGLWPELENTPIDWNYTTVPQPGLNNRVSQYSRGKVLGGCSSHNSMVYTRGSKDDWDRYAQIGGNDALKWDSMLPLLMKDEKWSLDHENQDETGHYDPAFHGSQGDLSVSAPYTEHPFNALLLKSSEELSEEFPFDLDWNDGTPIGTAWSQFVISHEAERSSAATAFLSKTGDNVHVLVETYVTRVIPATEGGNDFRVIEVAAGEDSERKQVVAEKEIIVAGGIFGTPQILLNSGIGTRDELEAVGINTLVENPSVGKNLSDHVAAQLLFSTNIQGTGFDPVAALDEWNTTRAGPLAQPFEMNQMSYVRLSADSPPFSQEGFPDPSGGNLSAHIEFNFYSINNQSTGSQNGTLMLYVINLHPVSRGSVTLNDSNPFHYPVINFGFLAEPMDVSILREGVRSARRLLSAPAFQDSVFGTVAPASNVTSDEDLEAFLHSTADNWGHAVGSASMSPQGADWGVVDPDFRVKGTSGLRVVDASVIPLTPSAHTHALVYGFAEVASTMIAADYE